MISIRRTWVVLLVLAVAAGRDVLKQCAAETIDTCGEIYNEQGCSKFYPYTGVYQPYALIDSLFTPGEYRVRGDVSMCFECQCVYCISPAAVSHCEPQDLGCGVLHYWEPEVGEQCYGWAPLTGEGMLIVSDHSFGGYADGDTVMAVGVVDSNCVEVFCIGIGCLLHESFSGCQPTSTRSLTWGRIKLGYR